MNIEVSERTMRLVTLLATAYNEKNPHLEHSPVSYLEALVEREATRALSPDVLTV